MKTLNNHNLLESRAISAIVNSSSKKRRTYKIWLSLIIMILLPSFLNVSIFGQSLTILNFPRPYSGVKPVTGERPLLVVLLEPNETKGRTQINMYALKQNGHMSQSILGITSSGELTGWSKKPHEIPMPQTHTFKSAPAILDSPDGNLQSVFALGVDGYIYQTYHSRIAAVGDWSNWTSWNPISPTMKFKSAPAAINSPDGKRARIFALGQDDFLYEINYIRGPGSHWDSWTKVPGVQKFQGTPAVINTPTGNLSSIFALGQNGYIYQILGKPNKKEWYSWSSLATTQQFKSAPAVINSPDGKYLSVYALGQDAYYYKLTYARGPGNHWDSWTKVPGTQKFQSAPAVSYAPDGSFFSIYGLGQDSYMYECLRTNGRWGSWFKVMESYQFQSAPAVTQRLLHIKTPNYYRDMIFGTTNSVRGYYLENSYGKFTFKEAYITPWLKAQDDPTTPGWDESSYEFMHQYPDLTRKSGWLIQQVEKMTSFRFKNYDTNGDGRVTEEELCILWIYSGGGDARGRGIIPSPVPVPSLSTGVDPGILVRGGAGMSMPTVARVLAYQALGLSDLHNDLDVTEMGIASNDRIYTWYKNGTVSIGTSWDLDNYWEPYNYSLPPGKKAEDIVGMGIAKSNDHIYIWYKDGTVTSGASYDLDRYKPPYTYSLPSGKTPDDIVGMGIASNDHIYVWYKDGTVSSGTSADLDAYYAPYNYSLPPTKTPDDILSMGISANNHIYVWYKDGMVSSGTSWDLDRYRAPYMYSLPPDHYPGPGKWSLMADQAEGSHLDPWSKMKLGWLNPAVVKQSGLQYVRDIEKYPEAYILYNPTHGSKEYFIVENRWPGNSYEYLHQGPGIAVWHINENYENQENWARKTIHLLRAGGLSASDDRALWNSCASYLGYPLTPTSWPTNTKWSNGTSSGISISYFPCASSGGYIYVNLPNVFYPRLAPEVDTLSSVSLEMNVYPNPFTSSTTIEYQLPEKTEVSISIRNTMGQIVAQPVQKEPKEAGRHELLFEAQGLTRGIYFCILTIGEEQITKKLILSN